jgi:hypothetical protein
MTDDAGPRKPLSVEAAHGPLPPEASIEEEAHRYRLYQAQALIRLW